MLTIEHLTEGMKIPSVELTEHTEQTTYFIARLVMKIVDYLLGIFGQSGNQTLEIWIYTIVVFLISWGIGWIVQMVIVFLVRSIGKHTNAPLYKYLKAGNVFTKFGRLVPPVVFLIFVQFTLYTRQSLSSWMTRLAWIYIVMVFAVAITSLITAIWHHLDERDNKRKLPLKGLVQLIKGVLWLLAAIVVISIFIDKSPASLLAGLGAFAAVLMLVFKDSILGVVAGVQLSENDSLHVGDWIAVPGTNANGTVSEVSLTAVKVINWDKTVTTVPPYSLVSGGFTNYRNMQLSNTRRIQRSYLIDADSVIPLDDTMLESYKQIPILKDWIEKKQAQKAAGHIWNANNPEGLVNGSIETNLGVFRAYLKLYLDDNPAVAKGGDNTCFVTTLAQTSTGIPLQLYCFTSTSAWVDYEAIQASILEHVAIMLAKFNLYTFEYPTGRDSIIEGVLEAGKSAENLYGMPYPFYTNGGTPANPGQTLPPVSKTDNTTTSDTPKTGNE